MSSARLEVCNALLLNLLPLFHVFVLHVICSVLSGTAEWVGEHAKLHVQPVGCRLFVCKLFTSITQGCWQEQMAYTQRLVFSFQSFTAYFLNNMGWQHSTYCERATVKEWTWGKLIWHSSWIYPWCCDLIRYRNVILWPPVASPVQTGWQTLPKGGHLTLSKKGTCFLVGITTGKRKQWLSRHPMRLE